MRQLCIDNGITVGNLNKMNSDLLKANVYNLTVQKYITSITGLKNSAADGYTENFKSEDVIDMILYVERIFSDHL